jgi:hypothetical protein
VIFSQIHLATMHSGLASASGTEDPRSNPAKVFCFWSKQSNEAVKNGLKMNCLCAKLRNKGIRPKSTFHPITAF